MKTAEEEARDAEVLAERRAKKRELLMKMSAQDRIIEEDPATHEELHKTAKHQETE